MRRSLTILAVVAVAALAAPVAVADSPVHVNGGGQGTFGVDLDGLGDIDGSHFGVGVVLAGGSVRGHFECLMAGNADIGPLHLMAVEGKITAGSADADTASLTGLATVNLGNGVIFKNVEFHVMLHAGGPGVGQLQLTVVAEPFDGAWGDLVLGNGQYDLPPETVATGQISIR